MNNNEASYRPELAQLCASIRAMIKEKNYNACTHCIQNAMRDYPHAPHPHNLMGIVLEEQGDHTGAMKHFRAAWALDPAYLPCRVNLERYGSFFSHSACAFDENDCPVEHARPEYKLYYDDTVIGRVERQK